MTDAQPEPGEYRHFHSGSRLFPAIVTTAAPARNVVDRWPYPTVFFEHKLLYGVPQQDHGTKPQRRSLDRAAALFLR